MDGGLERAREKARACQEEVAHGGGGEVEGRVRRTRALQDLEVDVVEHAPEQLARGGWDRRPERGGAGDDGLPIGKGEVGRGAEAVVEEGIDVRLGRGNEADKAACVSHLVWSNVDTDITGKGHGRTSYVANAWSSEDADELRGRAAIVADREDVT